MNVRGAGFSFTKQPVQSGRAYCNYKCREQARRLLSYTRKKGKVDLVLFCFWGANPQD